MQPFLIWLENAKQISYTSWSRDGSIVVYIDQKRYVYFTDAIYHERWKKMARFAPWRVLNEILAEVRAGRAEQLEPAIV